MSGFYVSLIFFGILLILFSFLLIFLDKKKVFNFNKVFDDRKKEFVEIVNDAEQMIEELNKFSDYIVNQMDIKNEELNQNLKAAEEKVTVLGERARSLAGETLTGVDSVADELATERISATAVCRFPVVVSEESTVISESAAELYGFAVNSGVGEIESPSIIPARKNEKVIPMHNKYSEVTRLSQEGMYGYEIAKRLNMGMGEVELILGLRK